MCGIFASVGERLEASDAVLRALHHRGPDASGEEHAWPGTLLHTRLRIIDLSPAADQPLRNEDGSVRALFNGEIYNWRELRERMVARGHRMRSDSDGEVLVHLYEEEGEDMVLSLRGMFAFVVCDEGSGIVLAARDRLGIKPLYYAKGSRSLTLASELRALRAAGTVSSRVDPGAMASYLIMGSVFPPGTIYEGASELPPGHVLRWKDGETDVRQYWSPPDRRDGVDIAGAAEELRAALEDSVQRHLVADRPVGVFLSGGVDSAAVASLARRSNERVSAFTLTFREDRHEGDEAASAALHLGMEHLQVQVEGSSLAADLPSVIGAMDQPTSDGVNTWLVCRAAREAGLVVALSGLGGDEMFHGYPSFRLGPRLAPWLRRTPQALASWPRGVGRWTGRTTTRLSRIADGAFEATPIEGAYRAIRSLMPIAFLRRLAGGDLLEAAEAFRLPAGPLDEADPGRSIALLEARHYMRCQLLRDTDQMGMAHSMEVRVPLIDDRVTELALGLPTAVVEADGQKSLLTRALGDILPPGTAGRPKRGFTLPFEAWLRGPLSPFLTEALASEELPLARTFRRPVRLQLLEAFRAGRVHWSGPWAVAVLRAWMAWHSKTSSQASHVSGLDSGSGGPAR